MSKRLTLRQLEVLKALDKHQEEMGLSPTLEELGTALGINRVTVYGHVQALLQKGHLENQEPGASRGLELTDLGKGFLTSLEAENERPTAVSFKQDYQEGTTWAPQSKGNKIPLLGKIAAGAPIEALEVPEQKALSDFIPEKEDLYMLEVQGDSMIEDHITEGDLVIVRREQQPSPGQIVVAILENEEATLKKWYPEPNGLHRLQPANSNLQPIYTESLEIRGVVVSIIRQY